MAEGILMQVNKNVVQIDTKFYTVIDPKYVPRELNIGVTFETEPNNPTTIKFIKRTVPKEPKVTTYQKADAGAAAEKPAYEKKTYGKTPEENASIKRQAIMHAVSRTLIGSGLKGDALEMEIRRLYVLYQELVG
jgi:hypothetical protein